MSCSPFELKDYFFEELPADQSAQVRNHISGCSACREELEAMNLTRAALLSSPEVEPPRRIAFVSDQVFELKWWQKIWSSGPQLGFASAALLAAAIVVHAFVPYSEPPVPPPVASANVEAIVQAEIGKRLQPAVAQAVAAESRRTAEILQAASMRLDQLEERHGTQLIAIRDYLEWSRKNESVRMKRALYESGELQ